jgi:quinol monooxygenase YgiN
MTTSSEVRIFATVFAQPDKADEVRAALTELVGATRKEPGNVHYVLNEDPKNVGHFYFFEAYKDQAATDAHVKSPHLAATFAKIGTLLSEKPVVVLTKPIAGD